jgi:hypothetical protein
MELRVLVEKSLNEGGASRARLGGWMGGSWDIIWLCCAVVSQMKEAGKIGVVSRNLMSNVATF